MTDTQVLYENIVSNVVAVLMLVVSWRWRNVGRLLFLLLFLWAAQLNLRLAIWNRGAYLDYARWAASPYRNFILGPFARHTTLMVGAIAVGQGIIAALVVARGRAVTLGLVGAITFLVAIAPLGRGSAFPFSLTASLAALALMSSRYPRPLVAEGLSLLLGAKRPSAPERTYRQFDIDPSPRVQEGLALFRQACQCCHDARNVGARFGWDFVEPKDMPKYQPQGPAARSAPIHGDVHGAGTLIRGLAFSPGFRTSRDSPGQPAPEPGRTPGVVEVFRLIFLMVEGKRSPHSEPIMEQQPRMTKQGVRDLDFGQSTKRRVAAVAKSDPPLEGEPAAVPLVDGVAPIAVASTLEK